MNTGRPAHTTLSSEFGSVSSADGTTIAYERSGRGAPLVLVHGTTADHTRWRPILPALNDRFTVYAMDRRGRGMSGDAPEYQLEREFEDVAAVVNSIPGPVSLVGHSYGALCAMEGALRSPRLEKLVLYEPVFPVEGAEAAYPPGTLERFQAMLDRGDWESLLTHFLGEIAGVPESSLALMRTEPSWQGRLAAAHTIVREFADGEYEFEPARFRSLAVPTLLLVGEHSPPVLTRPSHALASALPHARVVVLPGQTHVAINTAPEMFARVVTEFLLG